MSFKKYKTCLFQVQCVLLCNKSLCLLLVTYGTLFVAIVFLLPILILKWFLKGSLFKIAKGIDSMSVGLNMANCETVIGL